MTRYLKILKETYNKQPSIVRFSFLLILAGQFFGLLIAPDKSLGTVTLLIEFILPLLLVSLLWTSIRHKSFLLTVLFVAFLLGATIDMSNYPIKTTEIKRDVIVDVALLEIYPLSGLGLGGYEHYYKQNSGKIIGDDATTENIRSPRSSIYTWWSSGGVLALIGYLVMIIYLIRERGVFSGESLILISVLLIGPASFYPYRTIFFVMLWATIWLLLSSKNKMEHNV